MASFDYTPTGETAASGAGAASVRYRFTGHPANASLDTYHALRREYHPSTYRWLGVDPDREQASLYVYASNNPVNALDRTGGPTSWAFSSGFKNDRGGFPIFVEPLGFKFTKTATGFVGVYDLSTLEWRTKQCRSMFTSHLAKYLSKANLDNTEDRIRFFMGSNHQILPENGLEKSLARIHRRDAVALAKAGMRGSGKRLQSLDP